MLKPLLLSLTIAALFAPGATFAQPSEAVGQLQFTLTHRERDGHAQLSLTFDERGHSQSTGPQRWPDLVGITQPDLNRTPLANVRFTLTRAAGVLACSGFAGGGAAAGTCQFDSDERFVAELSRRGIARPSERELFHIALTNFDVATLDELARHGYGAPTREDVVAIAIHEVDGAYVRDMARAGYRLGDIDDLLAFRIHDVTPDWIASMARLGPAFTNMPAGDLLPLRIHQVTPEFVREMRALGFNEGPDELVAMRIHDVTREYIDAMAQAGYRNLPADTLVAFRIHEVTPDFVRRMAAAGYPNLEPDELIQLRVAGVTPDYAGQMERARTRRASRRN